MSISSSIHGGRIHAACLINSKRSSVVGKTGAAVIPGGQPLLGGGVIGVSRYSVQDEACNRFFKWYFTGDVASTVVRLGGTSPLTNAYNGFENYLLFPWLSAARKSLEMGIRGTGETSPQGFSIRQYEYILGTAVRNVIRNIMTPQEAIINAQKIYNSQRVWALHSSIGLIKKHPDRQSPSAVADQDVFFLSATNALNYFKCIGLVVRRWAEDMGLTAVFINFLTLDKCGLPKMPFPECYKILGRGMGYAGEGDVLTAGLVGALASVYPNTTFTEMFCPDWEKDVLLLSHMGESNLNLAKWKPVISDLKFNYNSCGDTVGMYSCMRPGSVVLVNLAPMGDHFCLTMTQGEILDAGLEFGAYRYSTQGWYSPCKPLAGFLEEYSMAGGTHHSAMVYGAEIGELQAFGKMMGFKVHVIS